MKSGKKDSKQALDEYRDIELKLIDEPDGRIRLDIDNVDIESLADNIKEVGQIQPITLVKSKDRYEIIAGHRRYLAMVKLGRKTIKAIVKKMTREQVALERASENLVRTDLTPIEEGAIYYNLAKEYNMSYRQIADKFGIAASSVKLKVDILSLDPEIQKAIHNKKIYVAVGITLNKIDEPKQRHYYLQTAIDNGCTGPTAEQWLTDFRRTAIPGRTAIEQSDPLTPSFQTQKIYATCEICEEPVDYREVKMIRTCPLCYKNIIESLQKGGA